MCEIVLICMLMLFGGEENVLVIVYDIFGFYIDLVVSIDLLVGLLVLCVVWVVEWGDIEMLVVLSLVFGWLCDIDVCLDVVCFLLCMLLCCVVVGVNVI